MWEASRMIQLVNDMLQLSIWTMSVRPFFLMGRLICWRSPGFVGSRESQRQAFLYLPHLPGRGGAPVLGSRSLLDELCQAVAIAVAAQWISNFLVSATFPSLSAWSVGGTYCIYALMSLASAVFVWRWVPETKGKTLEEMSALWKSGGASR